MGFEIAGYLVRERLHQGREISVYRAYRATDGLALVAKIPNSPRASSHLAERLQHEHRILEQLRDDGRPGIVAPHALVPYEGGVVLLAAFAEGRTLRRHLGANAADVDGFLRLAVPLVEAIAGMHASDVVHRDLSPDNIVVTDDGDLTAVIDFDLATRVAFEAAELRSPAALEGTLAYMSPEQTGRINRSVDHRTDLYALGAVFYEVLTGAPPFGGADELELVHQHIARPPVPPSTRRAGVPEMVDRIILKLLAKAPEERYQSAVGLLGDLRLCGERRRSDGVDGPGGIEPFEIATLDLSSRFHVSERLYGRETEAEELIDAFRMTERGRSPTLVLVSGEPGIGKSSLVNEVHVPIVETSGYFVAGKFDQFTRNVPFASLVQALRDLVRQVLTEPEERLRRHRDAVIEALGPHAGVLSEVIPELERLTGPSEPAPELAPIESQNRFRQALRGFVSVFARPEHPLCILLDDVQWIDAATLDWIEAAELDRSLGPLMVICAYRDNEITPAHPFALSVERLRAHDVPIRHIGLGPLSPADVRRLVADTLGRDEESVGDLSALLHAKTGGNPFFANQLLQALHHDGALRFEPGSGGWIYDLHEIAAADITSNVVEYMTERLGLLPARSQAILQIAACVGSTFDLGLLATAAQMDDADVAAALREPVERGLVVRLGGGEGGRRHRFLHDRVQQAAYQLADAAEAERVHLRIGRRLLADCAHPEVDDRLFDLLRHLDLARALIDDRDERLRLAELNLAGAVRARQATAYGPALELVLVAVEVAPADAPARLRFELALEQAECEHLAGDHRRAEASYAAALAAAGDDHERSQVYERQIHFFTNQARFDRAYETGLAAARMLGMWMPARFIPPLLLADHAKILRRIGDRRPMDLVDVEEMTDERLRMAMRFMGAVAKAAYQIRPELCVSICARIVDTSLRHGYTPETAIGYLAYGVIFRGGVRGDHRAGYEFSQLVLALVDRFGNDQVRAETTFVSGYFANSWIEGLSASEEMFRRAYRAGLETGDFFHASCAVSAIVQNMLMRGADLEAVRAEADRFGEFLTRVQSTESLGTLLAIRQTIRNLQGRTEGPTSFEDDDFDEEAFVATLAGFGSPHLAHFYFVDKLLTLVLWDQRQEGSEVADASARYLKESPGMQHAAEHHFLRALLAARQADDTTGAARLTHLRALGRSIRLHRGWADEAPAVFAHKLHLLEAELHRLRGRHDAAAAAYDRSIDEAERQGYQQVRAMAHHRAGILHLGLGATRTARYHLENAAAGYHRWGATALADHLVQRYPEHLGGLVFDELGRPGGSLRGASGSHLDLAAVLKASQAISGEVRMAELLAQLMAILRESAGAERGVLFLADEGVIGPRAEVDHDGEVRLLASDGPGGHRWVRSVVDYVIRTDEPLVLADAVADVRFRDDPYVEAARPRSVLCFPLHYLGQPSGLVYLENNLATDAFTPERIEVLGHLSGQIGVSIANAELYERLEEQVRRRTDQLEVRNRLIRETFGRYLSDEIVDDLLDRPQGNGLDGEKRMVTLIVSDLRGFTPLSEDLPPEDVVSLINIYLGVMTEVLTTHKATIIDFIGDSIIAVFGAPFTGPDDAARAVACAIDMQRAMDRVNAANADAGYPSIGMGIAVHTGEVVVGSIGSEKRAKFTVLGSHVNLAARLESYTTQGEVVVSDSTRTAVGDDLEIERSIEVQPKGFHEPVRMSYAVGIAGRHGLRLPERRSMLVDLDPPLPITCVDVDGKHVGTEAVQGWLVAVSDDEAVIRTPASPEPLTNLRLSILDDDGQELLAYGKAAAPRDGTPADCTTVRLTSVPERTRALISARRDGATP